MTTGGFDKIAIIFTFLAATLLTYIVVLFAIHVRWSSVASHTFIPHIQLTRGYLSLLVAVLGTTISPYLFFWQSAHRIEEMREEDEGGNAALPLTRRDKRKARTKSSTSRFDVFTDMTFSNLVMFAIIVATASTLGQHGKREISSAADAAHALRPFAGSMSSVLFALGFIASGFLAIPVLAGSAAAGLSRLMNKEWGFSRSPTASAFIRRSGFIEDLHSHVAIQHAVERRVNTSHAAVSDSVAGELIAPAQHQLRLVHPRAASNIRPTILAHVTQFRRYGPNWSAAR